MAYKRYYRKRNYRRRAPRRAAAKKSLVTWGNAWKLAKTVAPYIAPMIGLNPEKKVKATSFNTTASYDSPIITSLVDIATGDDYNARDGRSLLFKKATGMLRIQAVAASTEINQLVRVIVFRWNDDTTPTVSDILFNAGTGVDAPFRMYNKWETKFSVIQEKNFLLSNDVSNGRNGKLVKINAMSNTHVKYDGTASTDVSSNNIYIMILSNILSTNSPPQVYGEVHTFYNDN